MPLSGGDTSSQNFESTERPQVLDILNRSRLSSLPLHQSLFLKYNPALSMDIPLGGLDPLDTELSALEPDLDFIQENLDLFGDDDAALLEFLTEEGVSAWNNMSTTSDTQDSHQQQTVSRDSGVAAVDSRPQIASENTGVAASTRTGDTHGDEEERHSASSPVTQSWNSAPRMIRNNDQNPIVTPYSGVIQQYHNGSDVSVGLNPGHSVPWSAHNLALSFQTPHNQTPIVTPEYGVMQQHQNGGGLGVGSDPGFSVPPSAHTLETHFQRSQWQTQQPYQPAFGASVSGINISQNQRVAFNQPPSHIQAPGLMTRQPRPPLSHGVSLLPAQPHIDTAIGQKRKRTLDEQSERVTETPTTTTMAAATDPSTLVTIAGAAAPSHSSQAFHIVGGIQLNPNVQNILNSVHRQRDPHNVAAQLWTVNGNTTRVLFQLNGSTRVIRGATTQSIGGETLVELAVPHGCWALTCGFNAMNPNDADITTPALGQTNWTSDRHNGRPDVLFELHHRGVFDYTGARMRKAQHMYVPYTHTDGRIFMSHDGTPMRGSTHLPPLVSTKVPGWNMTAIRRLDSNVGFQDFVDRMPINRSTGNRGRPNKGTLETRCVRDRQRMRIVTWPEPINRSYTDRKVVEDTMRLEGPGSNSTRRLTDLTDDDIEIQNIVTNGSKADRAGSRARPALERYTKLEDGMKTLFTNHFDINSEEIQIVAQKLNTVAALLNRSVNILAIRRDSIGY